MKIAQPYPALTFDNVNRQLAELYRLANKQISIDNIKSLTGLPVLESDITDGTILARVASDETIPGDWTHTGKLTVFAGLNVVDANTRLGKDINNNLTLTDIVSGTLTLAELSCPPLVTLSASTQAEGNLSLTGFENKVLIKWIRITTVSTNWDLTLYKRNTFFAADAFQIVDGRSGNFDIFLDYPYEDENATKKLHINFTDVVGTATCDIEVRGYKMR